MKETKKNTIYQTPKVTVVNFKVEEGFANSPGLEKVTFDNDNGDGDLSNTTELTRWV